jgi:ABC-type uncharacterized transport system involved in gliding motility auxiliary subunit
MTVNLVNSLQTYHTYTVYIRFWPTLLILQSSHTLQINPTAYKSHTPMIQPHRIPAVPHTHTRHTKVTHLTCNQVTQLTCDSKLQHLKATTYKSAPQNLKASLSLSLSLSLFIYLSISISISLSPMVKPYRVQVLA